MATIRVIAKVGDTYHPKYGSLEKGREYDIEESDFGDEIFEKTKGTVPGFTGAAVESGQSPNQTKNKKKEE